MRDNGSIVRMEKRAVNKLGLAFIILLAIALLGGGIYFLVKNHNNLDFSFPWTKAAKEKKEEQKKEEEKEKIALERQSIDITGNRPSNIDSIVFTPMNIKYDEKEGLVIIIKLSNVLSNNMETEIYNLSIDQYQVDYNEKIKLRGGEIKVHTITIKNEDLDLYNIETFKTLYIYNRSYKEGTGPAKADLKKTVINNIAPSDNTQTPKIISNVGNADKIKVDYYKKEETADTVDVYFLVTNSSMDNKGYYTLVVNSYKVNNTILTNNDFKEVVYDGNKKIVKLSIPKSKFKSVDSLTISFFVLRNDDIYTTKATTINFNK